MRKPRRGSNDPGSPVTDPQTDGRSVAEEQHQGRSVATELEPASYQDQEPHVVYRGTGEPPQDDITDVENEDDDAPLVGPDQTAHGAGGRNVGGTRTLINMLRGMIGPGCLSLPLAFRYCGLWTGLVFTMIIGALNCHCMNMLIDASNHVRAKSKTSRALDYGHMAKKAVDLGPKFSEHGKKALYFANFFIAIYEFGVISVQFVFMGQNLENAVNGLYYGHKGGTPPSLVNLLDANVTTTMAPSPKTYIPLSTKSYISIVLLPVMLLNFIQNLKFLAYVSLAGNLCMVFGFIVIFQYILQPPNVINVTDTWFMTFDRFLLYLGSTLYAFEGQAMILPMENAMKRRYKMVRPFGVLQTGMALVTLIYTATGFFGAAKFGEKTAGSITLNLPQTTLFQVVTLIFVVAVGVGTPLQTYIVVQLVWRGVRRKYLTGRFYPYRDLMLYLFIVLIMLITYALAMLIPHLDLIIPLVGNTAGQAISFILPAALHIWAHWEDWAEDLSPGWRWTLVAKDLTIGLFGVFGMVAGLYANAKQMSARL